MFGSNAFFSSYLFYMKEYVLLYTIEMEEDHSKKKRSHNYSKYGTMKD